MAVTRRRYSNLAAATTTTGAILAAGTTVTVTVTTGFPSLYPWTAVLDRATASEELVLVTAGVSATLTITRGYGSTTAKDHPAAATFEHVIDATDADEANAHVNASTAVHGITGAVVGTTDTQTLTAKTVSSSNHLATSTDPGVKAQAAGSGTAPQIQCVNAAGSTTVFNVAQDGKIAGADAVFTALATGNKPLVAKGFSAGQTAALFEAQDSAAVARFQLNAKGQIVHKPGDTAGAAWKYVPFDASLHNVLQFRNSTDSADVGTFDSAGGINGATLKLAGFVASDALLYPADGSKFKVDINGAVTTASTITSGAITATGAITASGVITGSNGAGKVALTRITSGTQATTAGAEALWASLQTAAAMVSGRKYKVTVTVAVDGGAASQGFSIKVRNSKSASAPTTSSTLISEFRTATLASISGVRTWSDVYTADTTGTNTLGVSVTRLTGANEMTMSAAVCAAMVLVEDVGT